ncbi:hypothetical protein [Cohnella sp. 56]|uniref:hypothetical protein n=1 Tax=Cohnella sp. 56 TaxID=3113722 RepID=UPI0030E758CA
MSKLEGNDRWNSKLLLTEHHEQYEEEHAVSPPPSGHPTAAELRMIRDVILLPHMLTMVQKSMEEIERTGNLLGRLHLAGAHVLMDLITQDLFELRRELSRRRIRLTSDEQVDLVIYHHYICRGYEERFGIVREVLRSEISVQLARYIGDISRHLKALDRKKAREARRESLAPAKT